MYLDDWCSMELLIDFQQEKIRNRLKVKLEMAKFLQDTIEETALQKKGAKGEAASKFASFLDKVQKLLCSKSFVFPGTK